MRRPLLFLNNHSRREYYGVYRLWGTYGWSVSTILMGVLLFLFRHDSLIFYGLALAFILVGSASRSGIGVETGGAPDHHPLEAPEERQSLPVVPRLYVSHRGGFQRLVHLYRATFSMSHENTLEIGFILGTWTIFEIPVMLFSRKLIDLFGNRWLIISGLLLNGVRLIVFSFFTAEMPFGLEMGRSAPAGAGIRLDAPRGHRFCRPAGAPGHARHLLEHPERGADVAGIRPGGDSGELAHQAVGSAFLMQFCGWGSICLIFFFLFLKRPRESG